MFASVVSMFAVSLALFSAVDFLSPFIFGRYFAMVFHIRMKQTACGNCINTPSVQIIKQETINLKIFRREYLERWQLRICDVAHKFHVVEGNGTT